MTTHPEFGTPLSLSISEGRAVVRVVGDIDLLTARDLAAGLDALLAQDVRRIELHLLDAEHVDSEALETLVGVHQWLARTGGRLAIGRATERVAETIRRRGLGALLR